MSFPFAPEQASTYALDVDLIFYLLTGLTVLFSVIVLSLMLFFAARYRRGSRVSRKNASTGNIPMELGWSIGPLIMGCFVYAIAAKPFTYVYRPPADAMEIFVIGKRWMWHIQHTNGIRENNELHVPVGRAVKLTMISQDVIHGFSVPAFRVKRDVLPGRYNTCWFQATKPGKYHLFCTEYCGDNHSEMGGWVYVMEPADFQQWMANNGNREIAEHRTLADIGANLYETLGCANCHGSDDNVHGPSLYGLFGRKRNLTNGTTVVADDDYIRESIVNPHAKIVAGYQDIMQDYPVGDGPGFLSEEQILGLVAYIKTLGIVNPTATTTPETRTLKNHPTIGAKPTNNTTTSTGAAQKPGGHAPAAEPATALRAANAIVDTTR